MHRVAFTAAVTLATAAPASAAITSAESAMLATAARLAQDLRAVVPPDDWSRARCVVVAPAGGGGSGSSAAGVLSCRAGDDWSAPVFVRLERKAPGVDSAADDGDVVLLVMTATGVQKVLDEPAELGQGETVAPGRIARHTDMPVNPDRQADVVAYARSKGLFSGVDASGAVLKPDERANADAYGDRASVREILAMRAMSAPTQASAFLTALGARESMVPSAPPPPPPSSTSPTPAAPAAAAAAAAPPTAEPDIRARVVALQQAIDRLIVEAETAAPTGTTGAAQPSDTVPVSRERLMQIRRQLEAILAALDKRP